MKHSTAKEKAEEIFEEARLESLYIQHTIKSLTDDELTSIQMSNDEALNSWSLMISNEIVLRCIPVIAISSIASYILDLFDKRT